jgi:hypothetical protein
MSSFLLGVWVVNNGDPSFGNPVSELINWNRSDTKQVKMNSTTPLELRPPKGLKFDFEPPLETLSKTR